jgi:hypothetical protein
MKQLILTAIIALAFTGVFAQNAVTDSNKTYTDSHKKGTSIKLGYGDDATEFNINKDRKNSDTTEHRDKTYPKFSFGITLARLDLGLATLVDNGSFTLAPQNQFLRYRSWKTSNVGFDVLQMGVRFSNAFKVYLSGGFDWTLIRLRDNITILPNQPVLSYKQDNVDFSKNRFSSSYLRIPLSFEFRTNEDESGRRVHIIVGPEGGFLLNGRVKQISDEFGKQKINDSYNFATFRYGAFARIGYGSWGIFAKYYFNDMFENSPEQAGLKDFSFGIMLGF